METVPPEIISVISGFLDTASAIVFDHVLYKKPFERITNLKKIVKHSLEFFKLWTRYVDPKDICIAVAFNGTFEMFDWAADRFPLDHVDCLAATFNSNNVKIAETVVDVASRINRSLAFICRAAQYTCLDILKLMWKNGMTFDWRMYSDAISANRTDVLEWLHETGCGKGGNLLMIAVDSGHKEAINWCHKVGCPFPTRAWNVAVDNCDIPTIEHLISLGYSTDTLGSIIQTSNNPTLTEWADLNL